MGTGLMVAGAMPPAAWPLPRRLYVSARGDGAGGFALSAFDAAGETTMDLPLPVRGHGFALAPGARRLVAFGRRPQRISWVVDLVHREVVHTIEPPPDRHFYGHGAFSPDGRLLYATENDFEAGRGVIGVYDAGADFARVGELPSHGVGPHELRLMGDGTTLAVANGGLRTHPDMPGTALNVPTMEPSLVYLDRRDGTLLERAQLAPELNRLSIRHLDVGTGGVVVVAMQYAGPAGDVVPLVAVHRRGRPLLPLRAAPEAMRAMHQYCGSVSFDDAGTTVAVSAPRGDLITFWDVTTGELVSTAVVTDGCGVVAAAAPGEFVATSGHGGLFHVDARGGSVRALAASGPQAARWDNHLLAV